MVQKRATGSLGPQHPGSGSIERGAGSSSMPDLAKVLNLLYSKDLAPLVTKKVAADRIGHFISNVYHGADVRVRLVGPGEQALIFGNGEKQEIDLHQLSNQPGQLTPCGRGFYFLVQAEEVHRVVVKVIFERVIKTTDSIFAFLDLMRPVFENLLETALLREDLRETIRVTEQGRKRLALTRGRFRSFFHEAPVPYHVLNGRGEIIEVNDTWILTLGYDPEDIIGTPFSRLLSRADESLLVEKLAEMRETGEVRSAEIRVLKKDGTFIKVKLVGAVSYDKEGEGADSHCIFLDVSGRNRIHDLVLQSEKLHNIAGLAAGIAHEINTPLSGVLQAAELIEMFVDAENEANLEDAARVGLDLDVLGRYFRQKEIDYFLRGIKDSALRASNIIGSLLEFSRPGQDQKSCINLVRLIDSAVLLVQADYDLKKKYNVVNTPFVTDFHEGGGSGFMVYCCAAEIEQVVFNLLKNSVQAMAEGKTEKPLVTIRSLFAGDSVRLEIEDNGPGIKADVCRHMFDPFFTTKEFDESTGLGLTISKSIVCERHNGKLELDPNYRGGCRFIIELPVSNT